MYLFKKLFTLTLCSLMTFSAAALTLTEEPISVEHLPQQARMFIEENFHHVTVTRAAHDARFTRKCYEVALSDNTILEFDAEGQWTLVQCEDQAIPVRLVPFAIREYVRIAYPGASICKMERSETGYQIVLSSHLRLGFDHLGNATQADPQISEVIME